MHPWHFAMEYMPVNWSRLCANTKAHACSSLPMMHRQPVVTLCWSRDKNFSLAWQRAVYAYFICDTVRSPCTFFLPRCSQSPVPCLYIDFHINSFILPFVFGKIYCLPKGISNFCTLFKHPISRCCISNFCVASYVGVIYNMWMLEYTAFKCWTYIIFQYHGVVCLISLTQNKLGSYTTYRCWNIQLLMLDLHHFSNTLMLYIQHL